MSLWTKDEDAELQRLIAMGLAWPAINARLGHGGGARKRATRMGYYTPLPIARRGAGGGSSYIDHHCGEGVSHSWTAFTAERLAWLYGPDHATTRAVLNAADLAAWNRLGTREGRAA